MRQCVFDGDVRGGVLIRQDEVVLEDLADRRRPLQIGRLLALVLMNQFACSRGGEGFRRAAGEVQSVGCGERGRELRESVAL